MSRPLPLDDPAYWMLERGLKDPSKRTKITVYSDGCYICRDPEFSLMGLPVCAPCPVVVDGVVCGAHTPADDSVCDKDHDVQEFYQQQREND